MSSCIELLNTLCNKIDELNNDITVNMISPVTHYNESCIRQTVSYDTYNEKIKKSWNNVFHLMNKDPECKSRLSGLSRSEDIIVDSLNLSMINLAVFISTHCQCKVFDFFKLLLTQYRSKYIHKIEHMSEKQISDLFNRDYHKFYTDLLTSLNDRGTRTTFFNNVASHLTNMHELNIVGSELDRLIPAELGSLKAFFVKVISVYYENIHPVIWAQIFKSAVKNIFIEKPFTFNEIFSFGSKHLLLNSGPFILKMLQMIRPFLSPELATKYNLTKLKYPLLTPHQVETILSQTVNDWDNYKILAHYSASVGHVCKVIRYDDPTNPIIIKIIKPLAIVQSCWEYNTLHSIYPKNSCEGDFIIKMLESNGRELDVRNENKNIEEGCKKYYAKYNDINGGDIDAELTTIQYIPNIVKDDVWNVTAMSLAPGIPLSQLIERELIESDTKYRAKLHRCLDLLVYKFFKNIIKNGFYHGDLHSGNIFFSFKESRMSLIDFGAVGNIDIYSPNPEIKTLLEIIIMSTFNNYVGVLDNMTILINSKCTDNIIDMKSREYATIRKKMYEAQIQNTRGSDENKENLKNYEKDIFSSERIENEKVTTAEKELINNNSIYSYIDSYIIGTGKSNKDDLSSLPEYNEIMVETRDDLPQLPTYKETTISLTHILEEIIKYYATNGVNIAIKFNELYEFQKAYALLLGVLHKVHYNSYRSSIMITKAIKNLGNITKLSKISTVTHAISIYNREKNLNKNFLLSLKVTPQQK